MTIRTISTADLAQRLGDPNLVVVDVRPTAAYNGWSLGGEARGGHIRGAVACPLAWSYGVKADVMKTLLGTKGITPDKDVIAYCRIGERSSHTWFVLKQLLGYSEVRNYDGSWTEWGNMVGAPIER